jgi:hypothetical protein
MADTVGPFIYNLSWQYIIWWESVDYLKGLGHKNINWFKWLNRLGESSANIPNF